MGVFHHLTLFVLVIVAVQCDEHKYRHGAFRKAHLTVEKPDPFYCKGNHGIFSRSFRSRSLGISELKVSAVNYFNGETISVSWPSPSNPCKDDFIGIYFVETPKETGAGDYLDFEFVSAGQGNSDWSMLNLRRPLEFRYYSRDKQCTGQYTFIAKSPLVQPHAVNEPTQIHLAFSNQDDELYVSYVTNSSDVVPQCQYGLSPTSLTMQVNGATVTYKASDMCQEKANTTGPQAFIDPGFMHTMLLSGLHLGTTYYYRVGSDQHGWSGVKQFTNRATDSDGMVHFIAYGDMGLSPMQPGAKSTIDRVLADATLRNAAAILHIGDVSYARGVGVYWDGFMTQIEPTASRFPYMVGIGNHEYDHTTGGDKDPSGAAGPGGFRPSWGDYENDSGGECAVPMVHRFHSPSNGNGLFWYSFEVGPVHIVYYSTEHDFLPSSKQYAWLEKDLSSVSRTRTPWLIVVAHRPMYSSLASKDEIRDKLQEYIEPLLYKYHVDLHLFAHVHSYERTCPMYQSKCIKGGVTHALIGMGGFELSNGTYRHEDWSVYRDHAYGWTQIGINKTHVSFNYHHTVDGAIHDHFTLNK